MNDSANKFSLRERVPRKKFFNKRREKPLLVGAGAQVPGKEDFPASKKIHPVKSTDTGGEGIEKRRS